MLQERDILIMNDEKRVELLENVEIFFGIDNNFLKKIASSLKEVTLNKDETVFCKGDKYSAMYIIVDGEVKIHDEDYIFTYFGKNDFFGEYSLIDSSARSASVTITKKAKLLILEREVFNNLVDENSRFALRILKSLIKRLRNNNILEEKLTQQNKEISTQRKKLEELNLTKDKFFTIIAHDLKNPFNTVMGLSELLIQRYEMYDDEKIKFFISQINDYSNKTYDLLENLLQWAKSQTGKIKVKLDRVNLHTIVKEIKSLNFVKAEEKDIELINSVDKDTNVFADFNILHTILRNLLSNALKFTSGNGKITISNKVKDDIVTVCVSDTGIGISEENIDKLFKLDSNFSTEGTDKESGTGLGLISTVNKGTSLYFTLPIY
jgi:two-component system sensor histidine kinase/response regulator